MIKITSILTLKLLFISSIVLIAQDKPFKKSTWSKNMDTTQTGLVYQITDPGNGLKPEPGDLVAVHYIGQLKNGTTFDNSYTREEPLAFNYGVGQVIRGWDEAIGMMSEGGSARLVVPPNLGYGNRRVLDIPPNSTLYFKIELVEIQPNKSFSTFNTANLDTLQTNSGIRYMIVDSGRGLTPDTSSWAYLHYTGYLPDQRIFDASKLRGEPVRINPGAEDVIPAWDEMVQKMKVGGRYHIIVPPELGYGAAGLPGVVPPGTELRFDLELIHVSEKREVKPFNVSGKDTIKLDSGLQIIQVDKGLGSNPVKGEVVKIHFSGYFTNGELFQSSLKTDDPVIFAIDEGQVIKGLNAAVKQMRPNGKARVLIPWQLGYGKNGNPPLIPPKSDLIFDIELISVVQ